MKKAKTKATKTSKTVDAASSAIDKAAAPPAPAPPKSKKKAAKKKPAPAPDDTDTELTTPPTEAEMESLEAYPVITSAQLAHYLRARPDFESIANQSLTTWQSMASKFMVPGLDITVLQKALADRAVLAPIEAKIAPFFQRAHTNRMRAEGEAMQLLYALARAVKGAGSPQLVQAFAFLTDWVGKGHTGTKKKTTKKTT
jgi:hypothetical protein